MQATDSLLNPPPLSLYPSTPLVCMRLDHVPDEIGRRPRSFVRSRLDFNRLFDAMDCGRGNSEPHDQPRPVWQYKRGDCGTPAVIRIACHHVTATEAHSADCHERQLGHDPTIRRRVRLHGGRHSHQDPRWGLGGWTGVGKGAGWTDPDLSTWI